MKMCKYEDVTIANIEKTMATGYIEEIIFDADNKTIEINEQDKEKITNTVINVCEDVYNTLSEAIEAVGRALCETWSSIRGICEDIAKAFSNSDFSKVMNRKITKKKFMKLLQSAGIQRNEINKIIKDNKETYTYSRLYIILNEYLP